MAKRCVLVVDAGTGSARALAFDFQGNQLGSSHREWAFPAIARYPGSRVFDTATCWELIRECIAETAAEVRKSGAAIAAVTATSMREGMVLYDGGKREIWACPNIDSRAVLEAGEMAAEGLAARIYECAGDWLGIISPPRFRWLARNEPQILSRTRYVSMLSDWVLFKLSGEIATDVSCGSSSGLFELSSRGWSQDLIRLLGLPADIFPPVLESGARLGRLTVEAAAETGLPEGIPVIAGGADTQLALLGCDAVRPGDLAVVGGTFWQTALVTDSPLIDPQCRLRTLCHVQYRTWMTEGIGFLNGLAMRWLRDTIFSRDSNCYSDMERLASNAPAGSDGVFALVSNIMNAQCWTQAPTCFIGVNTTNPHHAGDPGRGLLVRAVEESAAITSLAHWKILQSISALSPRDFVFCGGASQGELWPQIMADVFDLPVRIPRVKEATSLGAAFCALVGLGEQNSLEEAAGELVRWERTFEPKAAESLRYRQICEQAWALQRGLMDWVSTGRVCEMWRAPGAII